MRLDRADNVPPHLLVPVALFWTLWLVFLVTAHALLHMTCRIVREKKDSLPQRNYIYCCWHDSIIGYLVAHWKFDERTAIIINYDWYMPPVHWYARRMGTTDIIKFFPRKVNRKAADEAVTLLKNGCSQFHLPDGPRGPLHTLKKGILHIAAESGVPIVPVKVQSTLSIPFPFAWDKKRMPLPFSKVILSYGEPVKVTAENFEEAERKLLEGLG